MNKLVIPAVLAATGILAAAAWSQNTPAFQNGGARMATGFSVWLRVAVRIVDEGRVVAFV